MARNAFWKGYLKLSLVSCPVALTPATTQSEKVRFHTVNRKTGRRVRSRWVDAESGDAVKEGDELKGYETEDGKFVTFTDDELEAVALESVRQIDIDTFVAADAIPWIWYDSPYYVTPTDKVGEEAFVVIREAMAHKGVVGIARLVLNRRERAVMLQPRDKGIVLWTLRYGSEVREAEAYFEGISGGKAEPKLLGLIKTLIEERSKPWDPSFVKDPVQQELKKLIAARQKSGKKTAPAPKKEDTGRGAGNVIDLMTALKKSMEAPKKKPARK
jgi:DNA end-binding protein Ku